VFGRLLEASDLFKTIKALVEDQSRQLTSPKTTKMETIFCQGLRPMVLKDS